MTRAFPLRAAESVPEPTVVTPEAARGLTRVEVAAMLHMTPKRVRALGIPCIRLGHRTVRYLAEDVLAFLRQHRRSA